MYDVQHEIRSKHGFKFWEDPKVAIINLPRKSSPCDCTQTRANKEAVNSYSSLTEQTKRKYLKLPVRVWVPKSSLSSSPARKQCGAKLQCVPVLLELDGLIVFRT